jgi:transposase
MADQVFKPYHKNQLRLLPLDLEEMIETDHMVRVVNDVVDALDPTILYGLYKGGGTSAYDPVMLLKVIVYAYSSGIYSSRKIEAQTKENIHFLWLSAQTPLDHMTINRFRSERMKDVFSDVFASIVKLLADRGHITLQTFFLDGTKIEANASKYSYVWKKSIDTYHERLKQKISEHLEEIDRLNEEEDALLGDKTPEVIDSDTIRDVADEINRRLREKPKDKDLKKTRRLIEEDWSPRLFRYEEAKETLGERNSCSKTDRDATFMRMKDDHLQNGQLKAAYNVQVSSEDQFICGYSVHQNPGDSTCMIDHLERQEKLLGSLPKTLVADAGYGSEENYAYLEKKEVRPFVKYNWFYKEQKGLKDDPYYVPNWPYIGELESYVCPQGLLLEYAGQSLVKSKTGYESTEHSYRSPSCEGCTEKHRCMKNPETLRDREIKIRPKMVKYRNQAKELLTSKEGIKLRKKRSVDIETVFGNIKQNFGFRRFTLRGIEKVSLEWGLMVQGPT